VAQGDILAFVDDDIIVDEEWLVNIARECDKDKSTAVFFGQTKLMQTDQARFAVKEAQEEEVYVYPCNPAEPGASNNMVVRRSVLTSVEGFDTSLGPGSSLRAAEDTDFAYRVLLAGEKIKYCPRLLVRHNHDRLTEKAVRSLLVSYGRARGGFYCKHILRGDLWVTKLCFWEIKWFFKKLFDRGRRRDAVLHLIGMLAGFRVRLGLEIVAFVRRRPVGASGGAVSCYS
jgi:GT2 family glycosyltransferase